MNRFVVSARIAAFSAILAVSAVSQSFSAPAPESFSALAENVLPAVVNVSTTQKIPDDAGAARMEIPEFPPGSPFEQFFQDFMGQQGESGEAPVARPQSLGSGFIIDAEKGLVVTNNHVIDQAEEIKVILHDDTKIDAVVVGRDEKTDLALLKIETKHTLKAVPWGDSAKMKVGDWVLAVGNPFGLGGTVTAGIISARQRNINAGPYDDFIQTDASINRGNSGGPMFDLAGEVIGINTAIFSPTGGSVGIGFAIPSDLAKRVIDQLIQYGETRRGWLGVRIQTVTDEIAESLNIKNTHGALIASVTQGGPADKAGLKAGDIIEEFDGQKVDEMRQLPRIVAETSVGKEVVMKVLRQGKEMEKKVTVARLEKAEKEGLLESEETADAGSGKTAKEPEFNQLGIAVSPVTDILKKRFNLGNTEKGVIITGVEKFTDAAEKGVMPGSIITAADQKPVETVAALKSVISDAIANKKPIILLQLNTNGDTHFVAVKLKTKDKK